MSNSAAVLALPEDPVGPLADVVFDQVLDAIYQGRLAPGSVINEVALAQEFGVSRGPVREAVRRLQGIQLVSREPYMKARVVTLSATSALELFQMRMALEGVACNLATRRMSDDAIGQLHVELDDDRHRRQQAARGLGPQPRVFDFHERIVRASGNHRIINCLCGDLYHLLRVYRRHSGTVLERKDDAYAEHWQILRAIQARDPELAESLMRSHIERAAQHLFDHLAEVLPELSGQALRPNESPGAARHESAQ
ncbi:GntR family transcriptional regulator [Bordetella holmesii]|uniref:FCD domain protein n=2 Tax=Bordetella holmesii TaxID=35814 RepID=A0A158M395_9BORD|nr:GntR family transcriptional regulator [Bordetella holmesii]EWM45511.1 bacterial regulatory s, gntR family protein [Bordetella holmesii 70147]EWM48657.1 bacterial regulatory s, gntR family protein [Bordetella holmesii 41130]EWM49637.1 bacterial regulatory s, gntR family protein [Bordetella holmesii 35009]AMD44210.1 GntR family transcriptional regulator [Bordetella holmesii H558]AMD50257.1 GntR family transcriptional regulator [Bordetella holmesii F627]